MLLSAVSEGVAVAGWVSAPVKLSGSSTSGSRVDRGLESAATQPAFPHAHDSASNTADPGGACRLQYLPNLQGKWIKEICSDMRF